MRDLIAVVVVLICAVSARAQDATGATANVLAGMLAELQSACDTMDFSPSEALMSHGRWTPKIMDHRTYAEQGETARANWLGLDLEWERDTRARYASPRRATERLPTHWQKAHALTATVDGWRQRVGEYNYYREHLPAFGVRWLTAGAKAQNALAQFMLGMAYLGGCGIEQDPYRAGQWLLSSANLGRADAQLAVATLKAVGVGSSSADVTDAYMWTLIAGDRIDQAPDLRPQIERLHFILSTLVTDEDRLQARRRALAWERLRERAWSRDPLADIRNLLNRTLERR